ncbi:chlororespiratory reduction protein 7 [Synechocystis sp. B12]|nr:chlororespiratory reduction protein 7 [Synechocystis sp. B12]
MVDPLMYQEEMFVFLADQEPATFLTPAEMSAKLAEILADYDLPLPQGVNKLPTLAAKAEYLRDNYCDLDRGMAVLGNGMWCAWKNSLIDPISKSVLSPRY